MKKEEQEERAIDIVINDPADIDAAAREFTRQAGDCRVIAFYGQMGAGKTTFIKAVCEVLGVTDTVTSPTFAIVNEYTVGQQPMSEAQSPGGTPAASGSRTGAERKVQRVYHFDLYRVKRLEEVYDMGYEDYFYDPEALCLIEWPELAEELLPPETLRVTIDVLPGGSRQIRAGNAAKDC